NAGKTLLGLINDVLDFSKIEAGKMEIIPVEYDLTSTINDLYNMVSFRAKEKKLNLIFDFDTEMPHLLYGDEIRIKQCVLNLLNNSVKYTETGSVSLRVTFERAGEDDVFIDVCVQDTGIGIRQDDLDKLFSPFQRIDERNNLTVEGTGLGMSIVRNLLHAMNCDLQVESEYGHGTKFSFRIRQRVISWEPIGDFTRFYREMNERTEKLYESFHAPDARILVVDDTQMNLAVVQGLLKPCQVQVDTALSGTGALVMLENQQYDVALIDYRMPNMDGVELLHRIRASETVNNDIPCIVLTANAISGAMEEYLTAGFDDYLSKPVNGQLLEQMLIRYLPTEKVIFEGMEGFGEKATDDYAQAIEGNIRAALAGAKVLDLDRAMEYCDNPVILRDALEEFYLSIDSKADAIEGYAKDMDFRNYTILVHALKGGARLIGALELSSYAAYLEECGDNEREDKIRELTPELLRQYRQLKDILAPIAERDEEELSFIEDEQLQQVWEDLKELIEVYDFSSADRIMEMLKDYRMPESEQEKYDKVRELMAAVDRDHLLAIL
ncbi:MAG: response regulator, partial [Lachnospiraceae bacterium]|nr:response regulator [Lachnospiraceae bacterium]